MTFEYPQARRGDTVDDYHGTTVADPYRWLEDPDSPETAEFVRLQNEISLPYLAGMAERGRMVERMTAMWNVPRTSAPAQRNGVRVWTHNDGLLDQPLYMVAHPGEEPRVLIDPNTLSDDGATAVIVASLSPDGAWLAYTVADGGTDWQVLRIRDTRTGEDLDDELRFVKFTSVAWNGDGFYYSRFPAQDIHSVEPSRNQSVAYHELSTDQERDRTVWRNPENPDLGYDPSITHDERYLVLVEYDGTSVQNGLLYLALDRPDAEWVRLAEPGVALHNPLAHVDGAFVVHTDLDAPNGRVVSIQLDRPEAPSELIAETDEPIETAIATAGRLALVRMRDASHRIDLFDLDGSPGGTVPLPEPGTVAELSGRFADPDLFVGFQSFVRPPTPLRWNDGEVEVLAGAAPPLDPSTLVIDRVSATSTDGAEVGMFVIRRTDAPLPGPVELYGYGGFNISLTPMFNPARLAFLEAGGVVAVANLRGGSELGEDWHRQGMLGSKQQVFDDFIACAEHLIATGVASAGSVGIRGGSNGGLLTAACMLQRPDLFGAVVSQVPVTDMLRYQHFTAGRYWTVEYGDAADPEAFEWLIRYSPYHRVTDGMRLPPLLVTTAEGDDRVVPMHAYKLVAAVQHAAGGRSENPLLLRVETRAGHGLGKPTSKLIEESADIFGFLLHHLRP